MQKLDPSRLAWVVLAVAASGVVPPGNAAPLAAESAAVRIRYQERDLADPDAARRLLRRIDGAALEACGADAFSLAEYRSAVRASRCWRDAVDGAVRRVASPLLSAAAHADQR